MNKVLEKATPMENWLEQNAKMLKKKDDFYADELRLISIVEGDLQFIFRAIVKNRSHELMEENDLF